MSEYIDSQFIEALYCEPEKRTLQELQIIYYGLHSLEPLSSYRDSILRSLCKLVRYEKHQVNEVLFYTGEFAKCWYILLSGAVFIGGSMFLPGSSSFGKRNGGSARRSNECFVLETSEMIVIEYPEISTQTNTTNILNPYYQVLTSSSLSSSSVSTQKQQQQQQQQQQHQSPNPIRQQQKEFDIKSSKLSSELLSGSVVGGGGGNNNNNNIINLSENIIGVCNTSTSTSTSTPATTTTTGTINKQLKQGKHLFIGSIVTGSTITQPTTVQSQFDSLILTPSNNSGSILYHRNSTTSSINPIGHRQHFNMDPHHIRHSGFPGNRPELYQKCNRGSHSSDTSSAYSGSDTMTSVHSSSLDVDEVDLSGLQESVVDSDEEDLAESMDSLNVRDAVRECLEKDPSERTEDDIEILLEFTQGLKAFTNMTLAVRRALCTVMVFAVVDKAKTMVMNDGEELDSWSVLINGNVEIEYKNNNDKDELQVGDSFGILPTMDKLYHRGIMRTKCDDCQFVCITQNDYYRIQHQGEENIKRHEENGNIVMVTELRQIGIDLTQPTQQQQQQSSSSSSTNLQTTVTNHQQQQQQQQQQSLQQLRRGHVVIRGTIERLLLQLIDENSIIDPTYIEDFLLTHRTFINNTKDIVKQLLKWFDMEQILSKYKIQLNGNEIRDRCTRVILLWVNNHFTDFETDTEMMELLEIFELGLEKKQMYGQLRLLHIACAAKARIRNITLTRSSRDENLNFQIIGGYERGNYGIFILQVDKNTKPDDVGLKRGDQILEVNGQSFEHVTYIRALEILMGTTHLSITVRSNLLSFKDMLQLTSSDITKNSPKIRQNYYTRRRLNDINKITEPIINSTTSSRLSTVDLLLASSTVTSNNDNNDQVDCVNVINQTSSQFKDLSNNSNNSLISCGSTTNNFVINLLNNSGRKDNNISMVSNTSSISSSSNNNNNNNNNNSGSGGGGGGQQHKGGFMTLGPKRRLQKALIKMNLLPKNSNIIGGGSSSNSNSGTILHHQLTNDDDDHSSTSSVIGSDNILTNHNIQSTNNTLLFGSRNNSNSGGSNNQTNSGLYQSHSNPDLTTITSSTINSSLSGGGGGNSGIGITTQQSSQLYYEDNRQLDYPEHVLKVYKSDQTCKYLLINKETTAHEVVMLALQEFGIHETSSNFSLCEVSVGDGGMIKQRRLPDQLQNLAERIGLSARYYLKTNGITETLVPDDLAPDLIRESQVNFLQLNANELSIQLTFQDFNIFRQIESTEYIDDLFNIKSKYGIPMLKQFSELVNREMFWVVSEVCKENNMVRRMKIIKQFIKIARHCKEYRNFNSMFAIISGLGHVAVSRLRQTWEKLPNKYTKLFNDLQDLMDPSRNMSKYRQLITTELLAQNPIIPFYPVVKKDLTFIHLGNDTYIENLINFEKLRMIAKEIRLLTHMCSSTYDLLTMLEFKGQPPSSAMVALNQMSVSTTGTNCISNSNNICGGGVGGNGGINNSQITHHLLHPGNSATVKRRKKSTAAPNPKKMFEEAQMVRRVKAYLNNMKVITDEDLLHNLSLECEPSTNSGHINISSSGGGNSAPNTITIRKRHPSPTLSTTSSTSSTSEGKRGGILNSGNNSGSGPKFGTASPQAVKKILSLSETTKTRPHQPRHPGIPLPLVGHPHALHHSLHHSSISPSPSPGAHRRMGSSSSIGTGGSGIVGLNTSGIIGSVGVNNSNITCTQRAIHERSHSDTPTPLPSVDLSAESSSVTSLSNLPLRKNITSGSITSSDSGHGSCVQADTYSNCSDGGSSGLYHVASSIVHNSPSPTLQQRRHSSIHGSTGLYICSNNSTSSSTPSPNGSIISGGSVCVNNFINTPISSSSSSSSPPPPIPPHHSFNLPPLPPPSLILPQQQQSQTGLPTIVSSSSSVASSSSSSSASSTSTIILDNSSNNIGLPLIQHQQQQQKNLNTNFIGKQNSIGLLIGGNSVGGIGIINNNGLNVRNYQLHHQQQHQQIHEHLQQKQQQQQHQTLLQQTNHLHNSITQQQQLTSFNNLSTTPILSIITPATTTATTIIGNTKMLSGGIINNNDNNNCNNNNNNNNNNLYVQQQQSHLQYHTGRNVTGHGLMAPPPPKGPRHPPAYSVAAQMARLHRLGRAHSHEGVTSSGIPPINPSIVSTPNTTATTTTGIGTTSSNNSGGSVVVSSGAYYHAGPEDDDDDEGTQVSAV